MRIIASFALVAAVLAAPVFAGWTASGTGAATFKATGPGGFKMEGKTAAVSAASDDTTVTVTVALKDLATGISLRDKHMRDKYLEVEKFPTTTLAVPLASLKIPAAAGPMEGDATGKYTLHGVTKDLAFHYKGSCGADGVCTVEGTMAVNMKDHGINVPSYLGITVRPDITVGATFGVKRP